MHAIEIVLGGVAAAGGCGAAYAGIKTLKSQIDQAKTDLWRSVSLEFSHELKSYRKAFGAAYLRQDKKSINESCAPPIIQFFETVAYLVNHDRIDGDLVRVNLWDSFSAYVMVTRDYWSEENKMDSEIFQEINRLNKRWGLAPWTQSAEELNYFFKTEAGLVDG